MTLCASGTKTSLTYFRPCSTCPALPGATLHPEPAHNRWWAEGGKELFGCEQYCSAWLQCLTTSLKCREARTKLSKRPWRVDHFDAFSRDWFSRHGGAGSQRGSPWRRVMIFVDNAGVLVPCTYNVAPPATSAGLLLICIS